MTRGDDIVPIPGAKHRRYLEENVSALRITLSQEDLVLLDRLAPLGAAARGRYPESQMGWVDR
jgi:aryl-alcohol dehydrogenase-like predicted oxidoreductase